MAKRQNKRNAGTPTRTIYNFRLRKRRGKKGITKNKKWIVNFTPFQAEKN